MKWLITILILITTQITLANDIKTPEKVVDNINKILSENNDNQDFSKLINYDYITKVSFNPHFKMLKSHEQEIVTSYTAHKIMTIYNKSFSLIKNLELEIKNIRYNKTKNKALMILKTDDFDDIMVYTLKEENDNWKIYDLGFNGLRFSRVIKDDIKTELKVSSIDEILKNNKT